MIIILETIRQLYPEDRFVTHDTVIIWARDLMIDEATRSVSQDDYDRIAATIPHPTFEDAILKLEDAGLCTFQRQTHAPQCEAKNGLPCICSASPPMQRTHSLMSMADILKPHARACWPKAMCASREAAQAQLRSIIKRGLEKNNRIHPYRCPHCRSWHVGH